MAFAFREAGFRTVTIDLFHDADLKRDITALSGNQLIKKYGRPAVVWASPPCETFSVASIGKYWKDGVPDEGILLLSHALRLIMALRPEFWFIENPRGMMRSLPIMKELPRKTITFCQYGERRMKPTDIWTNCNKWIEKPPCKNGDTCHEAAPRGSKTGTQGIKGAYARGVLPMELCSVIAGACKK